MRHPKPRVFAPALTPFHADQRINRPAFVAFCRWLLAQGAGLAVFGTNSEANSLALDEKRMLLDDLAEAGVPGDALLPGVGLCALPETIALAQQAVAQGCAGVLALPPFYFKPASEDGLFDAYARIIEGVASPALRLYLYHIPQFTGVPITLGLIERLRKAYPHTVVGIKDSSGDWANTESLLREFPGFEVFPASESLLPQALPLGAAGCISATANVQAGAIAAALRAFGTPGFDAAAAALPPVRQVFQGHPMIPALKHVVARHFGDDGWRHVRPPLRAAEPAWSAVLDAQLAATGFRLAKA